MAARLRITALQRELLTAMLRGERLTWSWRSGWGIGPVGKFPRGANTNMVDGCLKRGLIVRTAAGYEVSDEARAALDGAAG